MKLLLFLLFIPSLLLAGSGKVFDNLSLQSDILGSERKYAVYLPPDYDSSERSYPVLYLLHGSGDDQTGWVQFGEVLRITDNAIREGKATPMIIIMPDANTGVRGYSNDIVGDWHYEDFFFDELIPHVEKKFRIKGEKRFRAIAGLSMGGGGTFYYTLHRPDMFSSACPLSASTGPLTLDEVAQYAEHRKLATGTEEQNQSFYERHSVVHMANTLPVEDLNSVRWYIDCGDGDFLASGNARVHIAFNEREIEHEYRVRDGAHNWTYWRESLPEVLRFVSDAFHQH